MKELTKEQEMVRRIHGIAAGTVRRRVSEGVPLEQAIRKMKRKTKHTKKGKSHVTEEEKEIIREHGLSLALVRTRLQNGNWTREEALTLPIGGPRKVQMMQREKEAREARKKQLEENGAVQQ